MSDHLPTMAVRRYKGQTSQRKNLSNTFSYRNTDHILDSHIPVKEKRVKKSAQPIWFTSEINEAMKKRDKLLKKARISESPADWATFKCAKNEVCNLIRNAKEKYFKN